MLNNLRAWMRANKPPAILPTPLETILGKIDRPSFDAVKAKYDHLTYDDYKRTKYLDLERFFNKNINHAEEMGLLGGPKKRILDLGSGCGFFAFICKHYGHEVECVDLPGIDIFDDMMEVFGLHRMDKRIEPMQPMSLPWRDFDLIVGLMVKFDAIGDDNRYGPDEWQFFLDDCRANYLHPGGQVYLEFNKLPNLPEVEAANIEAFRAWGAEVTSPGLRKAYIRDIATFRLNRPGFAGGSNS